MAINRLRVGEIGQAGADVCASNFSAEPRRTSLTPFLPGLIAPFGQQMAICWTGISFFDRSRPPVKIQSSDMPDHYFHYTSRQAAQSIGSMGKIEAGASGGIYLSLDVYSEGTRATDA